MRKFTRKQKIAAAATAAVIAVGGGVAYAYWSTTGSGTGSASTGDSTPVTVAQVGTIAGLTPGGPAQAVDFKINNPATGSQHISAVDISISGITQAADATGACTADDFALVQPDAINQDLAPGNTSFAPSGATGCKNAKVDLAFTAR
jgi:hypothetical protein